MAPIQTAPSKLSKLGFKFEIPRIWYANQAQGGGDARRKAESTILC